MPKRADKTAFEKKFGISLSSGNIDIKRGISISLEIEGEGKKFYVRNARKIQNIEIKRFIEFLAHEEGKHIEILKELRSSIMKNGAWIDASENPKILQKILDDLRVFKAKSGEDVRETGDVAILLDALKTEKDMVEFYEKFSRYVRDPGGKKFFLKLADWERTHYQLLEGIYNSITFFRMKTQDLRRAHHLRARPP
jgi:rubrerythrin